MNCILKETTLMVKESTLLVHIYIHVLYHWRTANISEYYNHRNSRQHAERAVLVDIL